MCFYITTTLPKDTDIQSIRTILDRYNMQFSPIKNSKLEQQIRSEELYFRATKDYCDCDTSLGALNRGREYQELLSSKKVKTLRKKKWTDKEIDDWIKNKLQKKPLHSKRSITEKERQIDLERWLKFITDLFNSKKVSRIGILKHWYRHGLQEEDITLKSIEKVHVDDVQSAFLLNLEEDVLYEFFPQYEY